MTYTLAPETAVTPLQMRKIKHLTRNMSRYTPSSKAVTWTVENALGNPPRVEFFRIRGRWSDF
jgi:hypothetical protein